MAQILIFTQLGGVMCCCCTALLDRNNVEYEVVETSSATPLQILLLQSLDKPEFPAVFIGDVHVGSYEDLELLDSTGKLEPLLETFAVPLKPCVCNGS